MSTAEDQRSNALNCSLRLVQIYDKQSLNPINSDATNSKFTI